MQIILDFYNRKLPEDFSFIDGEQRKRLNELIGSMGDVMIDENRTTKDTICLLFFK